MPEKSAAEVQRAFFQGVDIADHQDGNKTKHAPEDDGAVKFQEIPEDNRPWIHEDDLDIEEDEQHRDEVKLHTESRLRAGFGKHAAFVGEVFGGRAFSNPSENQVREQSDRGEPDRDNHMNQYGNIVLSHRVLAVTPKPLSRQARKGEKRGRELFQRLRLGLFPDSCIHWEPSQILEARRGSSAGQMARRLIEEGLQAAGWKTKDLENRPGSDPLEATLAQIVWSRTTGNMERTAHALKMRSATNVRQQIRRIKAGELSTKAKRSRKSWAKDYKKWQKQSHISA